MIRPICATWLNSVNKKHWNWKATNSWRAGISAVSQASKDILCVLSVSCQSFLVWNSWEVVGREMRERERGSWGCANSFFGKQMKSTANRARISIDSSKWMLFYQRQCRAKCHGGDRCICCECCPCLYLFTWTPANQTSIQKEGRWRWEMVSRGLVADKSGKKWQQIQ